MTEIETPGGDKFVIEAGKWRAVDKTGGAEFMAVVFEMMELYNHPDVTEHYVPDLDLAQANIICERFGAKVTRRDEPKLNPEMTF